MRFRAGSLRFLVWFCCLVAAYYVLTVIPWVDRNLMYPVLELTARASSALLNLTGSGTTVQGIVIRGPGFAAAIQRGCDPLEPMVLFGAAVAAYPAPVRKKLCGLMVGTSLLFSLNLVRIATLYWAGRSHASWFETAHLEVWPALFILVSIMLWAAWVSWTRRSSRTPPACPAPLHN